MSSFSGNLSCSVVPQWELRVREMGEQQGLCRLCIDQSTLGPSGTLMVGPTLWKLPARQPSSLWTWL